MTSGLAALGLAAGERVRFRRRAEGRFTEAVVVGRERDGSVGLRDPKGAARALPVELIQVRRSGPRGGKRWEPLTARAARDHQVHRCDDPAPTGDPIAEDPSGDGRRGAEQLTLL